MGSADGRFAVSNRLLTEGLLLIAITYLCARTSGEDSAARRALAWIGGLAILPLSVTAFVEGHETWEGMAEPSGFGATAPRHGLGHCHLWAIGTGFLLRKSAAWTNLVAAAWVLVIGTFRPVREDSGGNLSAFAWNSLGPYFWAGIGALGMVAWDCWSGGASGSISESRDLPLTVIIFYFSNVMDKLGRSASLIGWEYCSCSVDGRWSGRGGDWLPESREVHNESVAEGDHSCGAAVGAGRKLGRQYASIARGFRASGRRPWRTIPICRFAAGI